MSVQQASTAIAKEPLSTFDTVPQLTRMGAHRTPSDHDEKIESETDQPATTTETKVIPLRYRLAVFFMILVFATGSSYAEATLSPLKSTLVKKLKINNAQYGAIASASSLVNTILPIIGGIGMDHWGAT